MRQHTALPAQHPPAPVDVQDGALAAVPLPKGEELERHALAMAQALPVVAAWGTGNTWPGVWDAQHGRQPVIPPSKPLDLSRDHPGCPSL